MRQKATLCNNKRVNSPNRCSNPRCVSLNNTAANHVKQKTIHLKREIDKSTILVGGFNASLSTMVEQPDRKKQKTKNKASQVLKKQTKNIRI